MKKFFIILFGISLTLNSLAQVTTLDTVNVGTVPNDGTGDPLRTAFQKLNANDQELNHYTPILVGDSMDVVRATLRSDINDTADILRAEWRSDINDSLPDSVLYAFNGAWEVDTFGTPATNQIAYFATSNKIGGSNYLMHNDTSLILYSSIGSDNIIISNSTPPNISSSSNRNTMIGKQTGNAITSGSDNSFFGEESGLSITTGNGNVFVGGKSGQATTYGGYNVFIGRNAGYYHQTGSYNTFLGAGAGTGSVGSAYNVFIGKDAGYSNVDGIGNIYIGYQVAYNRTDSNKLCIDNSNIATPLIYGEFDNDSVVINGNLTVNGYGTFDSTYTLITGWADYVLQGSFQKPEFKEIRLFWETNNHLPWIFKNGGVNKNGYVNQGRLLKQITEAVEYNYLYDAELREEVERLKNENEQLKRQVYLIYKALNK